MARKYGNKYISNRIIFDDPSEIEAAKQERTEIRQKAVAASLKNNVEEILADPACLADICKPPQEIERFKYRKGFKDEL